MTSGSEPIPAPASASAELAAEGVAGELLARELRQLAEHLNATVVPENQLVEAASVIAAVRSRLRGEPRMRWYDPVRDGGQADGEYVRAFLRGWSLYRGLSHPLAPPLSTRQVVHPDGPRLEGRVRCSRLYEGPPNGVHGGYVAGLFDDILGGAMALGGHQGVTGRLKVRYRKLTPVDTDLVLTAWIDHPRGRRVVARATCHAGDVLTAEAEGLFVLVDYAELSRRPVTP